MSKNEMKVSAKIVGVTQPTWNISAKTSEELIAYAARVSNPSNQDNHDTADGLLKYCMRNKHWSVFEMANAVLEVEAPRDITRQLLRHRSFSFQEFSQRYSNEIETTPREFRRQDKTNRQNSVDDLSEDIEADTITRTNSVLEQATAAYKKMIEGWGFEWLNYH